MALEACQLLFLDINMQGMDGLKTAMRIKEKYVSVSRCAGPPQQGQVVLTQSVIAANGDSPLSVGI